jgi:two-component system LytT family sensor kinase
VAKRRYFAVVNTLNRRKLFLYSSLFIAVALNAAKLLALRKAGVVAHFWHFDLVELSFQFTLTFLFCVAIFYYNKDRGRGWLEPWTKARNGRYFLFNLLILSVFTAIGTTVQHLFFYQEPYLLGGYGLRFFFCLVLVGLELRIWFLLEDARQWEIENEHLRTAYLKSELSLLKGQLNPHFFFNALSSLSAVVREDPRKAQQYIHHLSKVFRYSLESSKANLVPLSEELQAVRSFAELMKMRYEDGFELLFPSEEEVNGAQLPPMSLQLLVENALKHNIASVQQPLRVEIRLADHSLEVRNNLQPVRFPEPGTGIGLANLNERYKIILHREIEIIRNDKDFIVKLPLS